MLEPIRTEEAVLKLSRRFGWDNLTTGQLLRILKHAERRQLKLFRDVTVPSPPEFTLMSAQNEDGHKPTIYFKTDRFGALDAVFSVLDDAEKQSSTQLDDLSERVEKLEDAVLGIVLSQEPEPDKSDDLLAYEDFSSPEFYVRLQEMTASTGGTAEFGVKTDVTSRYFVRYHRLPALKIETMVAKALTKRILRRYAFYFELPQDLELLQQVLQADAKLYLNYLRESDFCAH